MCQLPISDVIGSGLSWLDTVHVLIQRLASPVLANPVVWLRLRRARKPMEAHHRGTLGKGRQGRGLAVDENRRRLERVELAWAYVLPQRSIGRSDLEEVLVAAHLPDDLVGVAHERIPDVGDKAARDEHDAGAVAPGPVEVAQNGELTALFHDLIERPADRRVEVEVQPVPKLGFRARAEQLHLRPPARQIMEQREHLHVAVEPLLGDVRHAGEPESHIRPVPTHRVAQDVNVLRTEVAAGFQNANDSYHWIASRGCGAFRRPPFPFPLIRIVLGASSGTRSTVTPMTIVSRS